MRRFSSFVSVLPVAALFSLPCLAATHARHAAGSTRATLAHVSLSHAGSGHAGSLHASSHAGVSHSTRGRYAERSAPVHHDAAPAMDPDRATAIQTALIHAGYLSGEPTGVWDADSIAAMQKLQDANGWQTKYTPDSRALLKLGLGGAPVTSSVSAANTETAAASPVAQP